MNVYMLEDINSGLFYRRQSYECWVEQAKASIWTNRIGPAGAKSYRFKRRKPVIRTFKLEPTDV